MGFFTILRLFGGGVFSFLKSIPHWLWLIILGAGIVGIFIFYGHIKYEQGKKDLLISQNQQVKILTKVQQVVTTKVVTKYKYRTKILREKGATIIQKVPEYVTVKDNSRCTINRGFVELWNYANQMQVPGPAASVDEEPSHITLTQVEQQHATEAEQYNEVAQRLRSLQAWIRGQQKAASTPH